MPPAPPITVDDITPEWMTAALADRFPGVRVEAVRQTKVIDGTAQKIRYELDYAASAAAANAPASIWVKGGFTSNGADQGEAFLNEVRFFRDVAPLLSINKPDCFYGGTDEESGNGVVVLEDLILRNARFGQSTQPISPDMAAAVLSLQARYHAAFWKNGKLDGFGWLKAGGSIAATGMVDQFFQLWAPASQLPRFGFLSAAQRDHDRMRNGLRRLVKNLKNEPICLLHGDSHCANLFYDPDGTPGYLDWQHTMRGHWAFDFANFIITSLTIPERRGHERALLKHYLGALSASGAQAPGFDDAWADYRRFCLWPFMWVMCPTALHPEEVCSLNAERACTAIEDLGGLDQIESP
jgi:hypothetical protein